MRGKSGLLKVSKGIRQSHLEEKLLSGHKSVLLYFVSVWFAACSAVDKRALFRVTRAGNRIIGCPLPLLGVIASSHCLKIALKISADGFPPWAPATQLAAIREEIQILKMQDD
ncbi:hypothetical protein ILYODFUR_038231 [Ilyodon furcidens]|uniref:Uncharacterized protein n=1 Tax=Ilyodon furcidens TaxID=33524 RepID=A0ABV0URG8_9TELE